LSRLLLARLGERLGGGAPGERPGDDKFNPAAPSPREDDLVKLNDFFSVETEEGFGGWFGGSGKCGFCGWPSGEGFTGCDDDGGRY